MKAFEILENANNIVELGHIFANLEKKLGEIERTRQIYCFIS